MVRETPLANNQEHDELEQSDDDSDTEDCSKPRLFLNEHSNTWSEGQDADEPEDVLLFHRNILFVLEYFDHLIILDLREVGVELSHRHKRARGL